MTTVKNGLWKDLSWIIRGTLSDGHRHGYRSGPAFGYIQEFAQVSSPNPLDYLEKPPLQGWGAEGPEDGYDPYAFGDQGWGFGPSQAQYKEVQGKIADMEASWASTEASHVARMAAARAEMEAEWAQGQADLTAKMEEKWDAMTANIALQNTKWAMTLKTRTAIVYQGVADARAAISAAYDAKVAALDAEEKEIRWAITSVWNYDRQHALNEALTEARRVADETCAGYRSLFDA